MKYEDMRAQCKDAGAIKMGTASLDICGYSGAMCSGHSCPSKKYWNQSHRQPGWHKLRALEKSGLIESFAEEMA